jgi:hypothetical protein
MEIDAERRASQRCRRYLQPDDIVTDSKRYAPEAISLGNSHAKGEL